MAVKIRIQHAAGRVAPLDRLLQNLPPEVEVITDGGDGPPNPWRGYQKCLSDLPADGHVCVLQDDTIVCKNFAPAVELIAAANPDKPVCLFVSGYPPRTVAAMREASMRGESYAALPPGTLLPVVATLWPVEVGRMFLEWAHENPRRLPGGAVARSDDAVASRWMRLKRQRVRIAIPSLVEHPDDVPSTIMRRPLNGKSRARSAAMWIGDRDPLTIDWS